MNLDGKNVSKNLKELLLSDIEYFTKKKKTRQPSLAVIMVGSNPASEVYVRNKEKACSFVGIKTETFRPSMETLEETIHNLNSRDDVDGILLQLPLPERENEQKFIDMISPEKDVDGITTENAQRLFKNCTNLEKSFYFVPCTPKGILELIRNYTYELKGKHVVILGRSNLVGYPLHTLLTSRDYNSTVTLCNSFTKNIKEITKIADILVSAVGKPKFIDRSYVSPDCLVIDVGINRTEEGLVGDTDFEDLKDYVRGITPVPGGIGPMTIYSLLENTFIAFKRKF